MELTERKEKLDKYLNKIVHFPMLYPDGSTRLTTATISSIKILESANMVIANFENMNYPVNCDILFDKQDTKMVSIKEIIESPEVKDNPS